MKRFIDVYNEIVADKPDVTAFAGGSGSLTYKEFDEASGRIYAYLKDKGLGKGDFVQILLPREVSIPVSVIGVMKAGAAFTVLEDTYPKERCEFIYTDCGCKVKIDGNLYKKIQAEYEPLAGNESTDPHDECYAVYTSGSTGNPKGVLHEYGNLEQGYLSFDTWYDDDIDNAAIFAPFYFVAGVIDIIHYISRGRTTYIIPHDMTRDFIAVKKFIVDNNIQELYLPPSYLRIYTSPAPNLKVIYTGSEPANGLTYNGNPALINFYAMSESGFVVLQSRLDTETEIAPVGKTLVNDIGICLIDDDGNTVDGPGQGELCFKNEYVRGYINLPEQTAKTWRDGLFHTNDCARRDEDGNYYIVGRFDDMIKINGNRVEPVEIEMQIKKLTGLVQVFAKGFSEGNRSYICAYYLNSEADEKGLAGEDGLVIDKDRLKSLLPDYMIPTYYVGMDAFPLTATGKVYRKGLAAPDTEGYRKEYVAPRTNTEKIICDLMGKILQTDRVSVDDDFYELGGSSMRTMLFISECNEAGFNVTSADLYDQRTPEKLAAVCDSSGGMKERDRIDEEAKKKKWMLLPSQKGNIAFGWISVKENACNINTLNRLLDGIDPERLVRAANKVLAAHPGMHVHITKEEEFMQQYDPSFGPDAAVITLTADEYKKKIPELDGPYDIFNEKLYRCNVYKTEEGCFFHLNVHHVICDATSRKLLLEQIAEAYFDEDYEVPHDYYFYMLNERFKEERWNDDPEGTRKGRTIRQDHEIATASGEGGVVFCDKLVLKDEKRDGSFFVTALAVAVAEYNGYPEVEINEVFSGRNELYTKDIAGELAISVTIRVNADENRSFDEIRKDIRDGEMFGTSHPVNRMMINTKVPSAIRFNYQKNTYDNSLYSKIAVIPSMKDTPPQKMNGLFSLNLIEVENHDFVSAAMFYSTEAYEKENMQKILDRFVDIVRRNAG